jgi:hypothetical protein
VCYTRVCLLDGTLRRHFGNPTTMAVWLWQLRCESVKVGVRLLLLLTRRCHVLRGAAHVIEITALLSHANAFTCAFDIPHLWLEARKTH